MPHMGRCSGYDWIARSTRLAIYARDENSCFLCGHIGSAENPLSLDHVDPKGPNKPENLLTLCLSCNNTKSDETYDTFVVPALFEQIRVQLAKPINRKLGLELAKARWPERFAQQAKAQAKLRIAKPHRDCDCVSCRPWTT